MKRIVLKRKTDGVLFALIPQLEALPDFERVAIEVPPKEEPKKPAPAKKKPTSVKKPVKITETPVAPETATDLDDIISGLE